MQCRIASQSLSTTQSGMKNTSSMLTLTRPDTLVPSCTERSTNSARSAGTRGWSWPPANSPTAARGGSRCTRTRGGMAAAAPCWAQSLPTRTRIHYRWTRCPSPAPSWWSCSTWVKCLTTTPGRPATGSVCTGMNCFWTLSPTATTPRWRAGLTPCTAVSARARIATCGSAPPAHFHSRASGATPSGSGWWGRTSIQPFAGIESLDWMRSCCSSRPARPLRSKNTGSVWTKLCAVMRRVFPVWVGSCTSRQ